jgi:hypothetical protein
MTSSQRFLITIFPYLISPRSPRSGAGLGDARDIISLTSGATCEDKGEVSSMPPKLKSFQASLLTRNNMRDLGVP